MVPPTLPLRCKSTLHGAALLAGRALEGVARRALHAEAVPVAHAAGDGSLAAGSVPPPAPGLGQPLPFLQRTGCAYLDYNATTPIFPEVREQQAAVVLSPRAHGRRGADGGIIITQARRPATCRKCWARSPPCRAFAPQVAMEMAPYLFEHFGCVCKCWPRGLRGRWGGMLRDTIQPRRRPTARTLLALCAQAGAARLLLTCMVVLQESFQWAHLWKSGRCLPGCLHAAVLLAVAAGGRDSMHLVWAQCLPLSSRQYSAVRLPACNEYTALRSPRTSPAPIMLRILHVRPRCA